MAAANAQIGIAIAGYFPDLTLSGSYGFASNVVSGLIAAPNNLWSVGATAIAMLCHTGRLKLGSDVTQWVGHALERPKIELLPFTPAAAMT
jgi:PIN domain nuclease of toxin-antitoxin system